MPREEHDYAARVLRHAYHKNNVKYRKKPVKKIVKAIGYRPIIPLKTIHFTSIISIMLLMR